MKILISNLGNRNIVLDGKIYNDIEASRSFRQWSHDLLKDYESLKSRIDVNIINPFLDPSEYKKIYLIYSDQEGFSKRVDQDTVHAAQIMKKIIVDRYGYEENKVILQTAKCEAVDIGGWMQCFRSMIRQAVIKNPDSHIILNDAGGTPQQKMALKIMADFLVPAQKLSIVYPKENGDVDQVELDGYRKIISTEIAIKLLHKGDYNAVMELLDFKDVILFDMLGQKEYLKKVFAHVYFRFNGNHKKAMSNLSGKEENVLLADYYNAHDNLLPFKGIGIPNTKLIGIFDILRKSLFYINAKRYSQAVLTYSQFYEALSQLVLNSILDRQEYGSIADQDDSQKSRLFGLINDSFPELKEIYKDRKQSEKLSLSHLSNQIMVMRALGYGALKEFATLLSPRLDYSINKVPPSGKQNQYAYISQLRNKIAHVGFELTESDVKEGYYTYVIELIFKTAEILDLKNPDLFEQLNRLIEVKLLRV